jgi:hypothetical protein
MTILKRVEASLADFHPRNQREFVVLQIVRRFKDEDNLAQYLNVSQEHSKKVLLEAARLAVQRYSAEGPSIPDLFFDLLETFRREASHAAS